MEQALDEEEIKLKLQEILSLGITSIAVVFIHSYTYPAHEIAVKNIAQAMY